MFPKKCFNGNFKISREVLLACNWVAETDRTKVVNSPGIYAIFSSENGVCLYVGQSQKMRDRLGSSGTWEKAMFEFGEPILYLFSTTKASELRYLECLAIGVLRPAWNFMGYVAKPERIAGRLKPDFISEAEFLQIFQEGSCLKNRAILALGYYGGLSASEICRMKWQDVDFEKNIISVNGRGGIARDVEMQESLLMPLLIFSIKERNDCQRKEDGYLFFASNGKSLNRTTAHRIIKDAVQKTEIVHTISLKTLRNSHGMNLFRQGESIEYIQKRLGVKNFKALVYECRQPESFWS